ncbi:glycosyltransferase [Nocardioides sp. zg-1228]|uniref:glycosyltransferase n=1 Tax=Nocardioides sp. zg-1228 TaxID=2763008 RepID=UPI001642FF4E|nr:glycosyltransferase [Nocardioides sp. zg-1228]MBC2934825.1 glycosyltransferase [Nocardioides sp. zg-1228]QSF58384.1 glycosyltransferase [Nocardioides sp. zg-1228]
MLSPTAGVRVTDVVVPDHLLLGPDAHGVTAYAGEVAAAARARVVRDVSDLAPGSAVHLHLTDRLFGPEPARAAAAVRRLAQQVSLTVTLHDVPQPTDGPVFAARAAAYGQIVRASRAWATNSWHEHALVDRWSAAGARGTVIPLPVRAAARGAGEGPTVVPEPVVGVFGFVYPGKGHRQVVRAVAALRRAGTPASVRVLGDAAPGHADELEVLVRTSRARGVPVEVAGRVPDDELVDALRAVAVGVTAHRNVSASASLNSWIAAGRRPLVRDGAYAREMAALRPGTITLFDDSTLVPCLDAALRHPTSTWTAPGLDLGPHLADTVAAYRAWWASVR